MPGGFSAPPSVVASWPAPGTVDPNGRGPALFVVALSFTTITTIIVVARIYSRVFVTRIPGIDDLLCVLSMVFAVALATEMIIMNRVYGLGWHMWDLSPPRKRLFVIHTWIGEWCFVLSISMIKISILLFYRRLSVCFTRGFMLATWFGIVANLCAAAAFLVSIGFMCTPLAAFWDRFSPTAVFTANKYHCLSEGLLFTANGGLSVFSDAYVTVVPMLLVAQLQLSFKQKLSIYSLFALGFLTVAAGITRTVYLYRAFSTTYDVSWTGFNAYMWLLLEVQVAIIASCGPALKPLVDKYFIAPLSPLPNRSQTLRSDSGRTQEKATFSREGSGTHVNQDTRDMTSTTAVESEFAGDALTDASGVPNWRSFGVDKPRDEETIGVATSGDEIDLDVVLVEALGTPPKKSHFPDENNTQARPSVATISTPNSRHSSRSRRVRPGTLSAPAATEDMSRDDLSRETSAGETPMGETPREEMPIAFIPGGHIGENAVVDGGGGQHHNVPSVDNNSQASSGPTTESGNSSRNASSDALPQRLSTMSDYRLSLHLPNPRLSVPTYTQKSPRTSARGMRDSQGSSTTSRLK